MAFVALQYLPVRLSTTRLNNVCHETNREFNMNNNCDGLRVAVFTGSYNHIVDGVARSLNKLVAHLEKNNIMVKVFSATSAKPAVKHSGELVSVPSVPIPGRSEYRLITSFPRAARYKLDMFRPTLIHIATPDFLGLQALRYAKRHQIPTVASYHTNFACYLKYYNLKILESLGWQYMVWFYNQFLQVYVPTKCMGEELRARAVYGDIRIWSRGVDPEKFSPRHRNMAWRRSLGFDDSDTVITFVSRLVWEKNLGILASALRKAMVINPLIKVLVVGEGPSRRQLEHLLPTAVFTGFLSGHPLARAYASSDIFMFPSDTETFGNVTLEAMASGLPAVVADATGSRSLVEHGVNGFVSPPHASDEFVRYLTLIAGNEDLRAELSAAARSQALTQHRWDTINSALVGNYREALNTARLQNKVEALRDTWLETSGQAQLEAVA